MNSATVVAVGIMIAALGAGRPGLAPQVQGAPQQASARPAAAQHGVISLVPGATETLFALGAGPRVIAVSSFDTWPPEVAALPRVGALLDPDLERILALRPALVVIDPAHSALSAQLHATGIATYTWPTGSIADILRGAEELAAAVESPAAGRALADRIRRELEDIAAAASRNPPRVLLVFGRRPGAFGELYVSGGVGFLHELIELAGGANVFGEQALPSFRASLEVLLANPPALVVEARAGGAAVTLASEWRALPGFGDVEVVVVDPAAVLIPGPRIVDTARLLQRALESSRR